MERRDFLTLLGLGAVRRRDRPRVRLRQVRPRRRPPAATTSSTFPIGAASRASWPNPSEVTMWHSMTSANLAAIDTLTDRFQHAPSTTCTSVS